MTSSIRTSVVLPCFNGGPLLRVQLDALAAQVHEGSWELVFVDNGSTDGSADMARGFAARIPNLRVVDASAERGQPYALNTGIRAARGSRILLCDADDEVAPGWLTAMVAALERHVLVAARVDHRRLNPPWLQWDQQSHTLPSLWYYPHVAYAAGATLGFRRTLFDEIGPFDPELPYLHDTEFCIQAQLRGVSIVLVPDAVVHYRRRASLKAHFRQSRNYALYNTILARRHLRDPADAGPHARGFLRDWLTLLRLLPRSRPLPTRYELTWMLGRQLGRMEGYLKRNGVPV